MENDDQKFGWVIVTSTLDMYHVEMELVKVRIIIFLL